MIAELSLGAGIGAGALYSSFWLQHRWDAYKLHLAESYGLEHRNAEEQAVGRLALVTRKAILPDLRELSARLERIEKLLAPGISGFATSNDVEEPEIEEPEPWHWKDDTELRQTAREVVDALVKMGQKKDAAEAMVLRAVERQTGPGIGFDALFTEAFRK